jgi:pimeloyl-ACP methyl ester carboxylesterase
MAVHSADGTRIAYDEEGEGPPLVLVTGALTDRGSPKSLAARLAGSFRVFSYDRRGRGKSTDSWPYAIEREIEDLEAIVEVAGGSAFVFGHSSGAILALYAAAHGSPITKLVAYEPPLIDDSLRPRSAADLLFRLEETLVDGKRDPAVDLFLTEALGVSDEGLAAIKAGPTWQPMRALAHTLPYDVTLSNKQALPPGVMAKIEIPILLAAGGASPQWARTVITELAAEIPNAETVVLDGQNHGVTDDAIVPVLEKFFS